VNVTDEMVEAALQAEHDQVGRSYVDTPFWYSGLDPSERIRAHDGMRAALEGVLMVEEVWEYQPDSTPFPSMIVKDGETFYEDGVTPLIVDDDAMRVHGYIRKRRLVTEWETSDG
jgi:hypothetical protein